MKSTEPKMSCLHAQQQLDALLDGMLAGPEKQQLERHLQGCAACQAELQLARQVKQVLTALPEQRCPESVSASALAAARREHSTGWRDVFSGWWARTPKLRWRPVLATAVLAALALFVTFQLTRHEPARQFSAEEIALAELDVKWTLAYLGDLGKRTGVSVRDRVLEPEVVVPLQQALRTVLPVKDAPAGKQ